MDSPATKHSEATLEPGPESQIKKRGAMKEPKMRHFVEGENGYVETWWTRREDGRAYPLASDDLRPVRLPEGLEATIATVIRHLPSKVRP